MDQLQRDTQIIRTLVDSIRLSDSLSHADLVYNELASVLGEARLSVDAVLAILQLGDLNLLKIVLGRCPNGVFTDIGAGLEGDRVFGLWLKFRTVNPQDRIAMFDLIWPLCLTPDESLAEQMLRDAIGINDETLLRHILKHFPEAGTQALLCIDTITASPVEFADFWAEIFSDLDPNTSALNELANQSLRAAEPHPIALMLLSGLSPRKYLQNHRFDSASWQGRLAARLASAHGEMEVISSLPNIQEMFLIPKDKLRAILAGPNAKQRRRAQKKAEALKKRLEEVDQSSPSDAPATA